jgi:UDP-N-acetylglucosamine 4-epimerase
MINRFAGKSVKANYLPIRKGDVFKTLADTTKIKTLLRFNPEFTFEQGMKMTFEWFKNKK